MDSNQQALKKDRFTMLIKEITTYGSQVGLKGIPYGEYSDSDDLYIRKSNMPVIKLKPLFSNQIGDLLEIMVEGELIPDNAGFSVITNVEPQVAIQPGRPVENPFLLGLSREYRANYRSVEFTNEFCYTLVHSNFVVPAISDSIGNTEGKIPKQSKVGFPMLSVPKDNKKVLPAFTDWGAFNKWTDYFKKNNPAKVLVLKFDDIAKISTESADGFVINPFSEPVPVPPLFIENIRKSEGYKSEKNVTKRTLDKDAKIRIGVPEDSDKIRLTKEALTAVGSANDLVKEIYLLAKQEENNVNLLAIFDLDFSVTEEERKNVFDEAYKAALPALGREMKLEFAMKAPAFIKTCANFEPFYKK
ncbi:MAG: enhanced serine sensitivity protein SseB [Clostridiales bacterium]|nr:enhanced serine sensitivity protein SseB [Clostridiales bacterium]